MGLDSRIWGEWHICILECLCRVGFCVWESAGRCIFQGPCILILLVLIAGFSYISCISLYVQYQSIL